MGDGGSAAGVFRSGFHALCRSARFRRPGAPDGSAPAAWYRRTAGALVQKTCDAQTAAKAVHDELERYYVHATDFAAVDALRGRVERELFA